MYLLSEKLKDIESFKSFKEGFVIKNKQKELYFNNKLLIISDVYDIFIFEKYLIFNKESSCYIYDLETTFIISRENQYALNLKLAKTDNWIFTDSFTNTLLYKNNFQFENEKLLIENYNWEFIFLLNIFLYLYDSATLSSLSLLTGEQDWELDLGGRSYLFGGETIEDKIVSVIGVSEAGKLAVSLQSENLVCVDVATGQILWESKQLVANIPNIMALGQLGFSARGFNHHWHLEGEKLYHLNANSYFSVDLSDGSVEVLWQSEPNWSFRQTLFTDDYVYFVGTNKSAFHTHVLGVFNRKALKIDWFQDLELGVSETTHYSVNINQAPQYGAGKLYVLDTGGTLHIFEKEQ